jgi:hypothetical protein
MIGALKIGTDETSWHCLKALAIENWVKTIKSAC